MRKRTRIVHASVLAATCLFGSCMVFPCVPQDDSGDNAFVRQVVPILHGRKVRGYDEVKLLSDLIGLTSRETVARVLMEQPSFIDHWSEVLVDDLRIDREGVMSLAGCYGNPRRSGAPTADLATALETTQPTATASGGSFNMSDVLRSAITADNLFPVYRAHLFPQVSRPPLVGPNVERQNREILGAKFGETYLGRQMGCLTCHNSEVSDSGEASGWNRTYPIWGLFEKALFGSSFGEPTLNAYAMFRTDQFGGLAPWGIADCGSYNTSLPVDLENADAHFVAWQGQQFGVHGLQAIFAQGYAGLRTDGLQRSLPPALQTQCDFCDENCSGSTVDVAAAANAAPNAAAVKSLFNVSCVGSSCHDNGAALLDITTGTDWANDLIGQPSSQKAGETRVIPGNSTGSYLIKKLINAPGISGSQMPLAATPLTVTQLDLIRAWINGLPAPTACSSCSTIDCRQIPQDVAGDEAMAFMVAATIVDNTWDEVFGSSVTIENYFPRTFSQRQVLWNLTEYNFVPNDWSLKSLLARIVTSDFFDRKPPATATGTTPYRLPLIFNPWVEADPRELPVSTDPAVHANTMADAIYRYSARSLTNSVHVGLDWPKPGRFPSSTTYPNDELLRAIGFYFSQDQPGFQVSDFQGLLNWESVHGVCQKPSGTATDWVDRLVAAISSFTPPSGEGPLSVRDVAIVMRDWLLGSGAVASGTPAGLTASEEDALRQLFGVASLDTPVSSVVDLGPKLRRACGVHLQAPQFQLAGLADAGLGPKPRLRVCNDPNDCTYNQMCTALVPAIRKVINANSRTLVLCGDDTVDIVTFPDPSRWEFAEQFCPPGLCGKLAHLIPEIYINPPVLRGERVQPLSTRVAAPTCNPAASRASLESCEAPNNGKPFADGDALVAALDGARVESAREVRLLGAGKDRFVALEPKQVLRRGDLLVVQAESTLRIQTKSGRTLAVRQGDIPAAPQAPRAIPILVTGPSQDPKENFAAATQNPRLPREKIERIMASERARRGEAGAPLSPEAIKQFGYSEAEMDTTRLRERGLLPEQLARAKKREATR